MAGISIGSDGYVTGAVLDTVGNLLTANQAGVSSTGLFTLTGCIADAYSYAVATDVPNPGKDEAVVTDANILAAVEAIVAPDTQE